jgi:hypothetical protein
MDPPEPLEIPYALPHHNYKEATHCYTTELCQPAHNLLDARANQLFTDLENAIQTHIDPWRSHLWDTNPTPQPGQSPPNQRYGEAIEEIVTNATEDIGDIFMTFISAHVQPLAHTQHGKHFTISPAGLLRYTPHSTQKHPRRITSRDLLDISPDIIQLDTLVGNLIDAHGRLLLDGI